MTILQGEALLPPDMLHVYKMHTTVSVAVSIFGHALVAWGPSPMYYNYAELAAHCPTMTGLCAADITTLARL